MRKKKHEEHENMERWLVSYADFITLLFAFFVVMYSTSSVNEGKYRAVSNSINAAFNPVIGLSATDIRLTENRMGNNMFDTGFNLYQRLDHEVRKLNVADQISVDKDHRGVVIRVMDSLAFDRGEAEILPDFFSKLDQIAAMVGGLSNDIRIEGHTDAIPIHTPRFPSNWELSASRATRILRHLVEHHQIDPRRLSAVGYGEFRPIASNRTPEGRAKNRRVEMVILNLDATAPMLKVQEEEIPDLLEGGTDPPLGAERISHADHDG